MTEETAAVVPSPMNLGRLDDALAVIDRAIGDPTEHEGYSIGTPLARSQLLRGL